MQFRDLVRQYEALKTEMDKAILDTTASGRFIMGPQIQELEQQLARYVGVKHCITCANGTDALTLALKAWGVGAGDAVFVPDFTFFSTAEVVALESATPIFVDVDDLTFNMDVHSLEEAIKATMDEGLLVPKAIIAVDLFGLPADYAAIKAIAERYGLLHLEDGAQGFGGSIGNAKACSFGDIATTSFFPAKPLGCYGDGGAVFTNNDEWASLVASYRIHGKGNDKYDNIRVGMNSRLDTLQAAVLQVKLSVFDNEVEKVNSAARLYNEILSEHFQTPKVPNNFRSSWAQYTIQLPDNTTRDIIQRKLKDAAIPTMVYYPTPMHRQTAFSKLKQPLDCDSFRANRLCDTVLSLPIHPYITENEIKTICSSLLASIV